MSVSGSASPATATRTAIGIEQRQIALHVDHRIVVCGRGRDARSPRECGPNPWAGAGSVMTVRPPAASTASAIARSPQATTTGPTSAATARRQTCTIIGTPAMSASGLPGSRVAASRAGIRMIGFFGVALDHGDFASADFGQRQHARFGRCRKRDNLFELSGEFDFLPPRQGSEGWAMSSFEWNKIIASVLTAMIVAMAAGILAGELVRPNRSKSRSFSSPASEQTASAPAGQPAAGPEPIGPLLAKADPQEGEQLAKVCARVPHFQQGRTEQDRPEPLGRGRGGHRRGAGLPILRCDGRRQRAKSGTRKS